MASRGFKTQLANVVMNFSERFKAEVAALTDPQRSDGAKTYMEMIKNDVTHFDEIASLVKEYQSNSNEENTMALIVLRSLVLNRWYRMDVLLKAAKVDAQQYAAVTDQFKAIRDICYAIVSETEDVSSPAVVPSATRNALILYGVIMKKLLLLVVAPNEQKAPVCKQATLNEVKKTIETIRAGSKETICGLMLIDTVVNELGSNDKLSLYNVSPEQNDTLRMFFDQNYLTDIGDRIIRLLMDPLTTLGMLAYCLRLLDVIMHYWSNDCYSSRRSCTFLQSCVFPSVATYTEASSNQNLRGGPSVLDAIIHVESRLVQRGFDQYSLEALHALNVLRQSLAEPQLLELLSSFLQWDYTINQSFKEDVLREWERQFFASSIMVRGYIADSQPRGTDLKNGLIYLSGLQQSWTDWVRSQCLFDRMDAEPTERLEYVLSVCQLVKALVPHAQEYTEELGSVLHTALQTSVMFYCKTKMGGENPAALEMMQMFLGSDWRLLFLGQPLSPRGVFEEEKTEAIKSVSWILNAEIQLDDEAASVRNIAFAARIGHFCFMKTAHMMLDRLLAAGDDNAEIKFLLYFAAQFINGGDYDNTDRRYLTTASHIKSHSCIWPALLRSECRPAAAEIEPLVLQLVDCLLHLLPKSLEQPELVVGCTAALFHIAYAGGDYHSAVAEYSQLHNPALVNLILDQLLQHLLRVIQGFYGQRLGHICLRMIEAITDCSSLMVIMVKQGACYKLAASLVSLESDSARWVMQLHDLSRQIELLLARTHFTTVDEAVPKLLALINPLEQLSRPDSKAFGSAAAIMCGILEGAKSETHSGLERWEALDWIEALSHPAANWTADVHMCVSEVIIRVIKSRGRRDGVVRDMLAAAFQSELDAFLEAVSDDPDWVTDLVKVEWANKLTCFIDENVRWPDKACVKAEDMAIAVLPRLVRQARPDNGCLSESKSEWRVMSTFQALLKTEETGCAFIGALGTNKAAFNFVRWINLVLRAGGGNNAPLLLKFLKSHPQYVAPWLVPLSKWCINLLQQHFRRREHEKISMKFEYFSDILNGFLRLLMFDEENYLDPYMSKLKEALCTGDPQLRPIVETFLSDLISYIRRNADADIPDKVLENKLFDARVARAAIGTLQ